MPTATTATTADAGTRFGDPSWYTRSFFAVMNITGCKMAIPAVYFTIRVCDYTSPLKPADGRTSSGFF